MHARQYIGRRIYRIHITHQINKNILPWKYRRPEIQSIGINCTDDQEHRHANDQKGRHLKEALLICKEQIKGASCNKHKPQQIRYDEKFHKWNIVIQRRMN